MGNKIEKYTMDKEGKEGYSFWCPGCEGYHGVIITKGGKPCPVWGWNGSLDKPTFKPSIMVSYPHSSPERNKQSHKFKEKHGRFPTIKELPHDKLDICHSYITDGKIQFLRDCTHTLKGQTVELLDFI